MKIKINSNMAVSTVDSILKKSLKTDLISDVCELFIDNNSQSTKIEVLEVKLRDKTRLNSENIIKVDSYRKCISVLEEVKNDHLLTIENCCARVVEEYNVSTKFEAKEPDYKTLYAELMGCVSTICKIGDK